MFIFRKFLDSVFIYKRFLDLVFISKKNSSGQYSFLEISWSTRIFFSEKSLDSILVINSEQGARIQGIRVGKYLRLIKFRLIKYTFRNSQPFLRILDLRFPLIGETHAHAEWHIHTRTRERWSGKSSVVPNFGRIDETVQQIPLVGFRASRKWIVP